MPPLARVGDPTDHPGVITGPGIPTVLIAGQPAAVLGDTHTCGWVKGDGHPPTAMTNGSPTVLIGGRPAVRMGDTAACGAVVLSGAPTVVGS